MLEIGFGLVLLAVALACGALLGWLAARGLPDRHERKQTAALRALDGFCFRFFGRVRQELGGRPFRRAPSHVRDFTQLNCGYWTHQGASLEESLVPFLHKPIRWIAGACMSPAAAWTGTPDGVPSVEAFARGQSMGVPETVYGTYFMKVLTDEQSGLVLRFIADYDLNLDRWALRVDALVR